MKIACSSLAAMALCVGCQRSPSDQPARPGTESTGPANGWLVYEDDMFRVHYPPGSEVFGAKYGKQDRSRPGFAIVPPQLVNPSGMGALSVQPDTKTKNMLLRDAIQSEIRDGGKGPRFLVAGPKEFNVKNGHCIGAVVMVPADSCPKGSGDCFTPIYKTQCDGPDGRRYEAGCLLTSGHDKTSLGSQAQKEAAVYERMLASLEFKMPSP